jgi:hypothetical protein
MDNPAGKHDGRIMHRPRGFPQGLPTGFPDFTHKQNLSDAAGGQSKIFYNFSFL